MGEKNVLTDGAGRDLSARSSSPGDGNELIAEDQSLVHGPHSRTAGLDIYRPAGEALCPRAGLAII